MTGIEPRRHRPLRQPIETPTDHLAEQFQVFLDDGFRLALIAGHDDRDALRVVYLLTRAADDQRVELHVRLDHAEPTLPTLAHISFPAGRFERELADLFGIRLVGHPLPRRLVHHQHWPESWHPMRHDAPPRPPMIDNAEPFPFLEVEGRGIYEIPVGPVHAGVIEPGHFRLSVVGETIITMKARLWFVHKGIERLFEGREPDAGVELAERISGDTAIGHNLAYCLALEDATTTFVPRAGQYLRALLLELERLYNHAGDIGALANDVGFPILNAHALRIRERLMRLNRGVTGHRLLRGAIVPGGAQVHALPERSELEDIAADVADLAATALATPTVFDRFSGTAVLDQRQAAELGTLGYVARASGVDIDARRDHPFCDLSGGLRVVVHDAGDVMARFCCRRDEFAASVELLVSLLARLHGSDGEPTQTSLATATTASANASSGVGIVEGWRGTIVHRIELDADACLTRVKVVDPSFFNWPAVPVALADTIVPDFPLTNKSFNLSYAGNDL
jgi:Ni,Fe-hydrogenase III large subunit/Ni,Fe-hydrogenase III component G